MAKKKKCECEAGAPLWMVTYGDLMSLLMTFFVLLLSFSTITEDEVFKETMMSFRGSLGFMPKELTMVQVNPLPRKMRRPNKSEEDLARKVQRQMQVAGVDSAVKVEYDAQGGLRISLPSEILFGVGSADLSADARPILRDLSGVMAELPEAFFEVEGHTDNLPTSGNTVFRDNHDLSYARADAVARYIQEQGRISFDQFIITGAGSGKPIAPNTTAEGRQANRRVELYIRGLLGQDRRDELQEQVDAAGGAAAPAQQ